MKTKCLCQYTDDSPYLQRGHHYVQTIITLSLYNHNDDHAIFLLLLNAMVWKGLFKSHVKFQNCAKSFEVMDDDVERTCHDTDWFCLNL